MDRQMNGILPPPWIMYPDKMFGGHEWQIGIGAMYLEVYTVWPLHAHGAPEPAIRSRLSAAAVLEFAEYDTAWNI